MVQVLPAGPQRKSFGQKLNEGISRGLDIGEQLYQKHQEDQAIEKAGIPKGLPREFQKEMLKYKIQADLEKQKQTAELQGNDAILRDLEKRRELPEGSLNAYRNDPKAAEQVTRPKNEPKQALTEKPVPPEFAKKIRNILSENKNATADEIELAMDEAGIPPIYSGRYTENRRGAEESKEKTAEARKNALRMETLPIRTELAKKAQAAEKGIQNKEELLSIIEKGDLNDPTFAALAESLPLNLGKRLLSNDTTEYKAGLVEEFGDLRNIFQGQTRIKEIDLLENKIADIYLTDDQKKSVLRSRINALRADIIRAEAAAELENRDDLGVLQFNAEIDKKARPRLEALFDQILDEQKSIIQNAENRKNIPLDFNDPDDKKIAEAIIKETKGNRNEARKLAKKKGYTF
jgi:hypothetical protein